MELCLPVPARKSRKTGFFVTGNIILFRDRTAFKVANTESTEVSRTIFEIQSGCELRVTLILYNVLLGSRGCYI
jgi:hypothetical protein